MTVPAFEIWEGEAPAASCVQSTRAFSLRLPAALFLILTFVLLISPAHAETTAMFSAAMDSITAGELYEHVEILADDVYEGRSAGSRGGRAAGRYLIKEIETLGLVPAGVKGEYTQPFAGDCRNILALQPGNDPELEQEVVIVGAHYDHVGYGRSGNSYGPIGKIHNGADDNASGSAVLLETLEAFATSGLRTRRTILFAFWDSEENGLVGSRHWVANPTLPLDRVKLALTIDMVGRLRKQQLYIFGTRSGYGMRRLMSGPLAVMAENSLDVNPLQLAFTWALDDNSDHWSFLERELPVALLHTGLHGDYHRPSDDAPKINREGMRDVSHYLLSVLVKIANEDSLPRFRGRATRETPAMRRALEKPLPPASLANWPADKPRPRLGISWREDAAEPNSVFLIRVVEGTPAAAAGLHVHDRIYEVDGQQFTGPAEFEKLILAALDAGKPEIQLTTERRGNVRTVRVKLASKAKRGIENDKETGRRGDKETRG